MVGSNTKYSRKSIKFDIHSGILHLLKTWVLKWTIVVDLYQIHQVIAWSIFRNGVVLQVNRGVVTPIGRNINKDIGL